MEEGKSRERKELVQQETVLTAAYEQIKRVNWSRRLSVGDEDTSSSKNTPRKGILIKVINSTKCGKESCHTYRMYEIKSINCRVKTLKIKAHSDEDRKDRELYCKQAWKQFQLLIALSSTRK